jgi:hypothetical protein
MRLRVEVKNDILGNSIFWEGSTKDIENIKNIPARILAKQVLVDGATRKMGMWVVSEIKEG